MKRIIRAGLVLLACMAAMPAFAVDRGRWMCNWCELSTWPSGVALQQDNQAIIFLKSDINPKINAWGTYDTVTICNGNDCIQLLYNTGQFFATGPVFKDNGHTYQNAWLQIEKGPVGGPSSVYKYFYFDFMLPPDPSSFYNVRVEAGPLIAVQEGYGGGSGFSLYFDWSYSDNSNGPFIGGNCRYRGCAQQ
jgi:hypothetical protein